MGCGASRPAPGEGQPLARPAEPPRVKGPAGDAIARPKSANKSPEQNVPAGISSQAHAEENTGQLGSNQMGTPRRADTRNGAQKEAQVPASHLHGSTGDSGGDARVALPNLQVAMSVSPAALATGSALATALQQWRVSDEVLGVLLRGGIHAMEVLARAPMVGPLAEVAPRVLQGIAEAGAVRPALEDFRGVVMGVVEVVAEAGEVLQGQPQVLQRLVELLGAARGVVEEVEGRTWLGRFVKARGDTDGLQELAGKVLAQVGTLTAAMQVQSLRGIEEIRAAISGGKLFSSKDLAQRLAREAGAARLEDVSPDQLRALLAERGRVDAVVALLAPGEQVLAGLVQGVEDRVEQLGARMDEQYASLMTHLRIGEVLDREPLEVKKLPPELRKLWADEDTGFGHMAAEMAWGVFHLALLHGELEVLAEAAAWYTDTLAPPQWRDFVIGPLRELLAPGDRVAAQNLYQLAQGAKRRGKLEFAEVRLQDVLWYVHVNTAPSVGQAAPPRQSRGHTWRRLVSAVSIARRAEWGAAARGAEPGRGSGHTESVADGVAVPAVIAALRHHDFLADADARDATFMVGTREWLASRVMAWAGGRTDGATDGAADAENGEGFESRLFLLLSLPGMGKTSFVAHMALAMRKAGMLLGGHFCRAGDESRMDPRLVVQSLAWQVVERVPAAMPAVEAGLKRLDVTSAGIPEWCRSLLIEPLRSVAWTGPDVVLVIDALDEAGTDARSNGVLQMLTGCMGDLPAWVKVLVTSRPEAYIVEQMARFKPFTLEPTEERNREDIQAFIRGSLRGGLTEEERAAVLAVAAKSEGVFAYVSALVAMVQRELSRDGGSDGLAHLTLSNLPKGHRALYQDYFDRQLQGLGSGEVEVVRQALLPSLVAAVEPLTVAELRELAGDGATTTALQAIGSLFPMGSDGRVRPFHKSVVDWLAEDRTSEWHVKVEKGHAWHAAVWGHKVEAVGAGGAPGESLASLGTYAATYALHHALEAGMLDTAAALCTSLALVRACLEAGEVERLVRDVGRATVALRVGGHKGWRRAQETQAWLRTFSAVLAEHPHLAAEAARAAPSGTWLAESGAAALTFSDGPEGTRPVRLRLEGRMARLQSLQVLAVTSGEVTSVAFSPSGSLLAVVAGQTLHLHDSVTGLARQHLPLPPAEGSGGHRLCFAPAPSLHLATWHTAGASALTLWEASSGAPTPLDTEGQLTQAWDVRFALDGSHVAAVAASGYTQWRVLAGERLVLKANAWAGVRRERPCAGCLAPDGTWAAVGYDNGAVRIVTLPSCAAVAELGPSPQSIRELAVSPSGQWVAAAAGSVVHVWDVALRQPGPVLEAHRRHVEDLAFEGAVLVLRSGDGTALWDAETWEGLVPIDGVYAKAYGPARLHPRVAVAGREGTVVVASPEAEDGGAGWGVVRAGVRPGAEVDVATARIPSHVLSDPRCLAVHPTEPLVAVGMPGGRVALWDATGGGGGDDGGGTAVLAAAVSADGALAAVGVAGPHGSGSVVAAGEVRVLGLSPSGLRESVLPCPAQGAVGCVAVSADGARVAAIEQVLPPGPCQLRVWDVNTGAEATATVPDRFDGSDRSHSDTPASIAFLGPSAVVCQLDRDSAIWRWDFAASLQSQNQACTSLVDAPTVESGAMLAVSPTGDALLASEGTHLRIHEATGQLRASIDVSQHGPVLLACFSATGGEVFAAHASRRISVWSAKGEALTSFHATAAPGGASQPVTALAANEAWVAVLTGRSLTLWDAWTAQHPVPVTTLPLDLTTVPHGNPLRLASLSAARDPGALRLVGVSALHAGAPVGLRVSANALRAMAAAAKRRGEAWEGADTLTAFTALAGAAGAAGGHIAVYVEEGTSVVSM